MSYKGHSTGHAMNAKGIEHEKSFDVPKFAEMQFPPRGDDDRMSLRGRSREERRERILAQGIKRLDRRIVERVNDLNRKNFERVKRVGDKTDDKIERTKEELDEQYAIIQRDLAAREKMKAQLKREQAN